MTASPEVRRFTDAPALGRALAADIAERIAAASARGRSFLLGCPGGRTPMTTYAALADEVDRRGLDLRSLVIVMMDDYVQRDGTGWRHVPADAHHSCRRFAREDIQAVLNAAAAPGRALPDENVWFPDPAAPPPGRGRGGFL
jgi:glucosamine-6-phosphate deaminase